MRTRGGYIASPERAERTVARLETDLRGRYVVGFRPERVTFGKLMHEVRVEVTRPDLSVRARKTYFEDPKQGR